MNHNEKPIILVVITFFVALTLVYIAFFRFQWADMPAIINNNTTDIITTGENQIWSDLTPFPALSGWLDEWWDLGWSGDITIPPTTWSAISWDTTDNTDTITNLWRSGRISTTNPKLEPRYGPLKVAPLVWVSPLQVYVDTGAIYYAYLGTWWLDTLANSVRRLWWNVLAIETQNDILQNSLRGDRILFINIPNITFVRIPTEERVFVAMIISMGDDRRLIETPIDKYHSSKGIMKSIFEQLYATKF